MDTPIPSRVNRVGDRLVRFVLRDAEGRLSGPEPGSEGQAPGALALAERPSAPGSGSEPSAFTPEERDALFADLRPLIRRLTRQYGDTHEMRQDLEGEIYCRFCELLSAYDPGRGIPLKAYLVRKLISSVYTYARSQWRRQRHEVSLGGESEATAYLGASDPTPEWDERIARRELIEKLPRAIDRLPHRQRQVVMWRFYESRSYEEIAEVLGVCQATVRSLMRHGLNNLRRQVGRPRPSVGA